MAKHILTLEAPETLNTTILRVVDTSVYAPDMKVECPLLEITLPGFKYPVELDDSVIAPGFMLNLTACDLDVESDCEQSLSNLPDGIYILKYSISPNNLAYVEYNHLRVSTLMSNYQKVLCELDLEACAPTSEKEAKMKLLAEIRMYIESAVAKVEFCHEPEKGMQLYTYAKKLLSKFNCQSCINQ